MNSFKRTIKYEAELDPTFRDRVAAVEGGENLRKCIQCGTCSGTCPLSIYMDHPPRRIIAMTRAGLKEEVLTSNTIWLCASCYSCTVHCPEQIKITDIMYTLKRIAIEEGAYPKGLPIPTLAKSFMKMVKKNGRSSEFRLILSTFLKGSLGKLFSMAPLGMRLVAKKRLPFGSESVENKKQLALILDALEEGS